MRIGSLVQWKCSGGEIADGYGVVIHMTNHHTTVYWLQIEDLLFYADAEICVYGYSHFPRLEVLCE